MTSNLALRPRGVVFRKELDEGGTLGAGRPETCSPGRIRPGTFASRRGADDSVRHYASYFSYNRDAFCLFGTDCAVK